MKGAGAGAGAKSCGLSGMWGAGEFMGLGWGRESVKGVGVG